VDIDELLKSFNWKGGNNAAALEKKLQIDLSTLEAVRTFSQIPARCALQICCSHH
jgi:hypothetical protein